MRTAVFMNFFIPLKFYLVLQPLARRGDEGCDDSVLLDDTGNFAGDKTAPFNLNSLRGSEVIDAIESDLESGFPETVSCAEILAVVATDSVRVLHFCHSSFSKNILPSLNGLN
uniref:peroxidase n=1 Tax=Salix viminalis TaxID=40686 RepID=A0A6N2MVG8_SALVM